MVVVVAAVLTTWEVAGLDALPAKFVSPAYVAVSDFVPAVRNVIEHVPVATLAVQLSVPSLTVTLPVGVPLPGATALTVKLIVTACPTTDGLGVCAVIVVAVAAWFTF